VAVRRAILAAAGAPLMAGTIAGFIMVRTVGIFGFELTYSTTGANIVLVVEAVAVVTLVLAAWTLRHPAAAGS
jgi:hypothetical protein